MNDRSRERFDLDELLHPIHPAEMEALLAVNLITYSFHWSGVPLLL